MLKNRKNYYDILGVTPDVELSELKTIYRRLVRKYHPDINPNGELQFKDITEAYETLSDEKLRKQYDILNGFFKSSQKQNSTKSDTQSSSESYRKSFKKAEDIRSAQDKVKENADKKDANNENKSEYKSTKNIDKNFSDRINEFIDGFSQQTRKKNTPPKSEKGGDVYVDVTITLRESIRGTHKVVNLVHSKVCEHCKGRKFINNIKCSVCDGIGELTEHHKIDVTIPANVKNGTKLRLAGEGKKGINGGKNGDLYLKITVTPDSLFTIEENNLLCEIPISPFEAVLGGDIVIPSLEGNLTLSLPKNTKSGQVFRISSKGLKKNNLVGDIIVTVRIRIPDEVSAQEIELYKKLRNLSGESLRKKLLND